MKGSIKKHGFRNGRKWFIIREAGRQIVTLFNKYLLTSSVPFTVFGLVFLDILQKVGKNDYRWVAIFKYLQ